MEAHLLFLTSIITISLFLIILPESHCKADELYLACQQTLNCGELQDIGYPFWSDDGHRYCGRDGFRLLCEENQSPLIRVGSQNFSILRINQYSYTMTMVRTDLVLDLCSSNLTSTSLNTQLNLFHYGQDVKNVSLFYDCPSDILIGRNNFTCKNLPNKLVFYEEDTQLQQFSELNKCKRRIQVPVSKNTVLDPEEGREALDRALRDGFGVHYTVDGPPCGRCLESGGSCGSNNESQFTCHCVDGPHAADCSDSHSHPMSSKLKKLIIGVTGGAVGALVMCIIICCCRIKTLMQTAKFWPTSKVDGEIEAFIRNHGPLALPRYKFSEVKQITKSFKVKLGQGGYGTVYKGELHNGCPVAVKILNASKGNGQDFINEVASISRTSHVNIVNLLGFCLEGQKKALIYEFMSNGSLDKFIYNKADETAPSLSWEKLYHIAIGIARGLEYLHRGCNTRILHFDIKPHNILLDESFCPKISDFGLAKLCPRKESIISISDARGTIGYLAPEVWNRNIGGVSHKSDVYSYGMMLLDVVGEVNNMITKASCTTETYFPDWIYDTLDQGNNFGRDVATTTEEHDIAKRMTVVGLWCIQTLPTHRPTIGRVIEMLEGSLDSLEIPPKPVMWSPVRSAPESSTSITY